MAQPDETSTVVEPNFVSDVLEESDAPRSMMETLRQARRESEADQYYEIEIPMYRGLLAVRYGKSLTFSDIDRIMTRAMKSKNSQNALNAQIDILMQCTVGFRVRATDEDEFETLQNDQGFPVVWGADILTFLDLPFANNSRQVVKTVFGNDIAIATTQKMVFEWIQGGLNEDSGREVTGE